MPGHEVYTDFTTNNEQVMALKSGLFILDCMEYIGGVCSTKSADVLLASPSQGRSSLVVEVMFTPDSELPLLGLYMATSNPCNIHVLQVLPRHSLLYFYI